MKLHIFNPEHDIALACHREHFTAPKAGRDLRCDLVFLPVLWAADGDVVLVDDARGMCLPDFVKARLAERHVRLVTDFRTTEKPLSWQDIAPWGWDLALRSRLADLGLTESSLPSRAYIDFVRHASHRQFAAEHVLKQLVDHDDRLTGSAEYATTINELEEKLAAVHTSCAMLKAPWSSSGRGVRRISTRLGDSSLHASTLADPSVRGWVLGVMARQGGVMVEPYYDKLLDFGVEFEVTPTTVEYRGLSLFRTVNGAYTGNLLATEEEKMALIAAYIDIKLIDEYIYVISLIISKLFVGKYVGSLGVDMMIVSAGDSAAKQAKGLFHPCVELNLRRTMGHVALSLSPSEQNNRKLMSIRYDGSYHLDISPL